MKSKIINLTKNPLFSGSTLMIGGSMAANAINYFYHLIMGRILGPTEYGILASVFALLYILSVVPVSASFAVTKFISSAKDESEIGTIFEKLKSFVFKLSIVLSLTFLVLSPAIAKYLHINDLRIIILVSPILFLILYTLVFQSTMQGMLKFWGMVGPTLVASSGKLLIGVLLVLIGWSVFGAITGILISSALSFLYAVKLSRKIPKSSSKEEFELGPFLRYSFPVLLQALAFTSLFTLDLILVKHYLSDHEAGLYAALSTLGKIIFFATQPITSVMFPIVSKKKSQGEKYKNYFFMAFFTVLIISLTITLFYYLFPNIAIGILYGKDYLDAGKVLPWMGIFISFYTLCYLIVNFLLSIGKTNIIILPLLASIAQIIIISFKHQSILQVVQVSFFITLAMFIFLNLYLIFYQAKKVYD